MAANLSSRGNRSLARLRATLANPVRLHIQPGQWVYAGTRASLGRFYGASKRTCVVAWQGNAKGRGKAYQRALSDYGRSVRND